MSLIVSEVDMKQLMCFHLRPNFIYHSPRVAMSLVDSSAAFNLRCDEIDDTKQMGILLNRQGINTFSSLAFAIGTPNQQPTEAAFDQFYNGCSHCLAWVRLAN